MTLIRSKSGRLSRYFTAVGYDVIEAGPRTFVFEVLGFNSSAEVALFVVDEEPAAALDAVFLVRGVFLTFAVSPPLEGEDGRFAVFLAIVR